MRGFTAATAALGIAPILVLLAADAHSGRTAAASASATVPLTLVTGGPSEGFRHASPAVLPAAPTVVAGSHVRPPRALDGMDDEALTQVVRRYCVMCHNDALMTGNLSLQRFDVAEAPSAGETAEKMINKLRLGMMPPPDMPRPAADTLLTLVETLERKMDEAAAARPNPGGRTFQRLNRAEYGRAVEALLGLEVVAGRYLPLDTKSDNFDNIADVQALSPTLLDGYLRAASDISWLAVGDPSATPSEATFTVPRTASQTDHVEGAPFGTRGGVSVIHTFPADGEYSFRASFYHETTGGFVGANARGERLEISIDGEPVAVLDVDRWMHASDPNGVAMATDPVFVEAGPRRVSAAFIPPAYPGVTQDLISPLKWSLASTANAGAYGFTVLPHLRDLVIAGPRSVAGVSDTPVRQRLFTCRPASPAEEEPCAASIVERLGTEAYRRPLDDDDRASLMAFYRAGRASGGFESGIRMALEAVLASPDFVFRLERAPADVGPGDAYPISDVALASRLSFFLWSAPPDRELRELAAEGRLSEPAVFEAQVERLLADPRSETLATRFAAQWLRLPDLDAIHPDVRQYPDFDEQLRAAMLRETELFFHNLVLEDRSVLELFTADYSWMNERLARHYGIPGVGGPHFRRVSYPDDRRRGLLGHASILTLTSHAGRTSAVDRGKWVMEVFLNSPPPPPPPGVPDLEATPDAAGGRALTVRERMEQHRSSPVCSSCHVMMDPIGLPLENFDVTGRWRHRDNGMPIDSADELWDGTPVSTPTELVDALMKRPDALLRTFTRNLMAYALGRRVESYDMPRIRTIVREAEAEDHRITAYIRGVVNSPAFRMQSLELTAEDANP